MTVSLTTVIATPPISSFASKRTYTLAAEEPNLGNIKTELQRFVGTFQDDEIVLSWKEINGEEETVGERTISCLADIKVLRSSNLQVIETFRVNSVVENDKFSLDVTRSDVPRAYDPAIDTMAELRSKAFEALTNKVQEILGNT